MGREKLHKYKVAVLGWEVPSRSKIATGAGMYLSYLTELGKFSMTTNPRLDLTFIVPWQKDVLLRKNGYSVLLLKTRGFRKKHPYNEEVLYPSCKNFASRLLKEKNPIDHKSFDLILANSFAFGEFISKAQHLENLVYISHRPEFLREKFAEQFRVKLGGKRRLRKDAELEAKAVENSDRVLAVSKACKKGLAKRYRRDKITVIYNGIDENVFNRVQTPSNGGKTVFTYIGRNHPEKGISLLLRSVKDLVEKDHGKNFETRLITDDGVSLRRAVKRLGLSNYVKLINWKMQRWLPYYYSGSTFTMMPSYWESFSYVVAESLSCETPVIVSRAGALPELVDRKVGLLFRAGDGNDLTGQLWEACERSHESIVEMGKRGRKKIQNSFSKSVFLGNYLKFIEETINGTIS